MTGVNAAAEPLLEVGSFAIHADVLFAGVVAGLTYALLGAGLVLVYRASRVVNVAHGEIGAFGALLAAKLAVDVGLPYLVALALAVVAGGAVGAAAELLAVRRLARAPRVVALVATIGLAQVMLLAQVSLPDIHDSTAFPTFSTWRTTVGGVPVRASDLAVLVVVPLAVIGLAWWLERTRTGRAVRAAADNRDAARLAGVSVTRVSTTVWAVAGALAVLTASLNAPVTGQSTAVATAAFGPALLLRALAAAMVGRFVSLPATLLGGIGVGVVDSLVTVNYPNSAGVSNLVLFGVILLLLLGLGRGRAAGDTDGSFSLVPGTSPLPAQVAHVRWLRRLPVAVTVTALAAATALPWVVTGSAPLFRLTTVLCLALVGLSVTVLTGWAGQLSLGQFAFAGIGAVVVAVATTEHRWPFVAAVALAGLVGAVVALVVGLQALHVRGLFLAVATLAFAVVVPTWALAQPWAQTETGAAVVDVGTFPGDSPRAYFLFCLAVLAVVGLATARLRRTGVGRVLIAVRDNEPAAAAVTVSVTRAKMQAFALAGGLAAVGGGLYAGLLVRFPPTSFTPAESLTAVAMTVIGGLGTVWGAVLGPAYVVGVPLLFGDAPAARFATSGIGLLVLLLYVPGGFAAVTTAVRDALVRLAATKSVGAHSALPSQPRRRPARTASAPRAASATGAAGLGLSGVTVHYGGRTALDGVDLAVRPGEILGLIGANGAGKSTLLDAVSGFVTLEAGRIALDGRDLTSLAPHRRAAAGVGRTFQNTKLFGTLTVRENVLVALESAERSRLLPSALGLPPSPSAERRKGRAADEVLARLGLTRFADSPVARLSTGTRQVCSLAVLIALAPRLVLLDEPTAGVAQRDTEAFVPLLRQVRADLDATVVVVEHDVPLLTGRCDRLACLAAGQVLAGRDTAGGRLGPRSHRRLSRYGPASGPAFRGVSPAVGHVSESWDESS